MNAPFPPPPALVKRARLEHILQRHLDAAEALLAELDELDNDPDLEPWLGSVGDASSYADQRRWADGADDGREVACEDEGAQDDREPDLYDCVPDYHPDDQRKIVTGGFGDHVYYTLA